jgi:hypothetical protein
MRDPKSRLPGVCGAEVVVGGRGSIGLGREGEGRGSGGKPRGNPGGGGEGCPRGVPPPESESAAGRPLWGWAAGGFSGVGNGKHDHLRSADGWFVGGVGAPGILFNGGHGAGVGGSWCLLLAAGVARWLR